MNVSSHLQSLTYPFEKAICAFDRAVGFRLTDKQAIEIFEAMLDHYAFGDSQDMVLSKLRPFGCEQILDAVSQVLQDESREDIAKALALVCHLARRRENGGRRHLDVLHHYLM